MLTDYLSEGLSYSQAEYMQYYRELLFHRLLDELKSGKDIRAAIKYTYWDTLIDRYPNLFTKDDVYSWDLMPFITKCLIESFLVENEFVSEGCWKYIYKE